MSLTVRDDKRNLCSSDEFEVTRERGPRWTYCKFCYKSVPTFVLVERVRKPLGRGMPVGYVTRTLCCNECDAGLDQQSYISSSQQLANHDESCDSDIRRF